MIPNWHDETRFLEWSSVRERATPEMAGLVDWQRYAQGRYQENQVICDALVQCKREVALLDAENEGLEARLNNLRASLPVSRFESPT